MNKLIELEIALKFCQKMIDESFDELLSSYYKNSYKWDDTLKNKKTYWVNTGLQIKIEMIDIIRTNYPQL